MKIEMNGKRNVNIYMDNSIQDYKIEIINSGVCSCILPASLIKSENAISAVYNVDGYMKLSGMRDLSASDVLSIVSHIIHNMEVCKDFLIYPEEYVLDVDVIYIDDRMEKVKLLYVPKTERVLEDEMKPYSNHTNKNVLMGTIQCSRNYEIEKIKHVIRQLKLQSSSSGEVYLEALEELLCKESMKGTAFLGLIESLKEEAKLCQA